VYSYYLCQKSPQLKAASTLQVSWGTKGFDKVEMVTWLRPSPSHNPPRERQELNRITAVEDKYKAFRTHVLTFWLLSNVMLALGVDNYGGLLDLSDPSLTWQGIQLFHAKQTKGRREYIASVLYITYVLVFIRFIGVRLPLERRPRCCADFVAESLTYLGICHVLGWYKRRNY
jgi:hypothetical protein